MKNTTVYIYKKTTRIISRVLAFMLIMTSLLILCNCSKDGNDENTASEVSDVSTNSQTQTSTEPEFVEKVTQIYSFEYGDKYKNRDYIQDTFYDIQSGNTLPYCLYIPSNYSSSKQYPVILFLHGAGEIGTDNVKHINNLKNVFEYNGDIVSDAFIVCPQSSGWWNLDRDEFNDYKGTLGSALHLLNSIMQQYSCDDNRIYVMGLSMGGYATWDLLERCGNIFAAGVPICGGGNYYNGAAYKDIPIKIYHGTVDTTVSFSQSELMYNAIVKAGGKKVDFIRLEGVAHNAWQYAFADRELFCWMFAQNKVTNSGGEYEYIPMFSVRDAKGKIIFSDNDVVKTSYHRESGKKDNMIIELTLTARAASILEKAYKSSNGSQFTFYYRTEKVYSFTATDSPKDNVFCISNVFNIDNYYKFYTSIKKLNKNKKD